MDFFGRMVYAAYLWCCSYVRNVPTDSGNNFWIARVQDNQGNPYDVAKLLSDSNSIYDADVDMEEGYAQTQDPFEVGVFRMWHPQFNSWVSGFKE